MDAETTPTEDPLGLQKLLNIATSVPQSYGPSLLDRLVDEYEAQSHQYSPRTPSPSAATESAYGIYTNLVQLFSNPPGTGAYEINFIPVAVNVYVENPVGPLNLDILLQLFEPFGPVQQIQLCPSGTSAYVVLPSAPMADSAISNLDYTSTIAGDIRVFCEAASRPVVTQIRKYTCRFDIGIDNDKEFHVARRIIGQKGANMKRIVKQAGSDAKLRLRGKGSGFLEGVTKQESEEPLHLCVSCKDLQGYQTAIALVKSLLEEVYADYKTLAAKNAVPPKDNLRVVVHEHPLLYSSQAAALAQSQPAPVIEELQPEPEPSKPPADAPDVEAIEKLIERRNEARRVCNFKEADRIRDILRNAGVGLMDEPGGRGRGTEVTTWRYWRS